MQIKDDIGLNFAAALRSFLRQDPEIILVGEMRDKETVDIGLKAALTGHLVLVRYTLMMRQVQLPDYKIWEHQII